MSGDECTPFFNGTLYTAAACEYVKCHVDACGGGGYLAWTQFVVCNESDSSRGLLIAASVLYMLYLFVALGTAADEFFSSTIASIAEQLGISENVAPLGALRAPRA
ncbi:CBN-NCX-6 protein [Aphelenchoides avenae]|nr:CBN-NCX-6 protein [Aphelenchus avenae]